MLYLIGGPPRVGKSSLAKLVLEEHGIPYVSTDGLTVMLKPIGQPSYYNKEKSNAFFPYLDLFISRIKQSCEHYVIEGDAFSPEHVALLKTKYDLRCVFLTMTHTSVESIIDNQGYDKWTESVTADHLRDLVKRIQEASIRVINECEQANINVFDLSESYETQFGKAYEALIDG